MSERVCCLYRVSTVKQVDFDEANQADIPIQKNACRAFAAKMGWTIVYEEQEAGVSGCKVSAEKRDKLQLIKDYAVKGRFDILLVFMFDRIGRKADETPFVVEWFVRNGMATSAGGSEYHSTFSRKIIRCCTICPALPKYIGLGIFYCCGSYQCKVR